MKAYRHILLATDFSEHSDAAGRRAVELARHYQARLTLIHVIEHFPEDLPIDPIAPENVDPEEYLTDKSHKDLAAQAARIGAEGAEQQVVFTSHAAKHAIVRAIEDMHVDLVVMGAGGRHGMTPFLGSTTGAVLHGARCDVLAVRL